mmetsp:Transcript_23575/g.36260  ORF Transcript_23575/g.36260 Transcript_23575/m.36260 type:complete len:152 (+) Transcript_23575:221-676(+)
MIVLLFGLLLAVVCCMMLYGIAATIYEFYTMQYWVQVPCTILETELHFHSDGDSDLFNVVSAKYSFAYGGKKFEGTRVGLHNGHLGKDNNSKFHAELKEHMDAKKTFRCFVDPKKPATNSVLYRRMCWEKFLSVVFFACLTGGFSFWIVAF